VAFGQLGVRHHGLERLRQTAYYIHQVQWIKDKPLIHIAPHWNWKQGENVRVMVMANVERIKLLLNGRDLGEQKVDPYRMNNFNVAFEPGKLEAIGYKGGKEVVRTSVETTGAPVKLELVPDRAQLAGDGYDAMPITVRALDAQGRAVPLADNEVTFAVTAAAAPSATATAIRIRTRTRRAPRAACSTAWRS
jgi:beta-galactosidase